MKKVFLVLLIITIPLVLSNCSSVPQNPEEITVGSWAHFKRTFIRYGRVSRPNNNNDTVSEGQAYGMIRAVLMNDRITFDECLTWTETVLSRKDSHGDKLLAWHFENGKVTDTQAASDADIDYAFALILAYRAWHDNHYLTLARKVLESILDHETTVINGRIYLLPWPNKDNVADDLIAQNPSYYAPSHFKLFYAVSDDKRWLDLADTTYDLLGRLRKFSDDQNEVCLVPDWIAIDQLGAIRTLPGKPVIYGWDAVRVPLRIAADYYLYGDSRALAVLRLFSASFEKEFSNDSCLTQKTTIQNALFYSAAYAATEAAGSSISPDILQRLRKCIRKENKEYYYNDPNDYYINSISWLPEYYLTTKAKGKLGSWLNSEM